MDFKNVLMAIVLSTIVLIGWATFFETPIVEQQTAENEITKSEDLASPSIDEDAKEIKSEIIRSDTINKTKRVKIENENIKGSLSLEGAIIDDIIFKNYNETLNGENKVTFLNPKNSAKEYFIETGWAVGGSEKVKLPLSNTIWKVQGNNKLTPSNPITLKWNNNEGLIFTKKIELDDKFLFKITQSIKNTSNKSFQFYPYAQITRNGKPEGRQIYILHEGFLGVFGDELKEEDYDDIEKEKFTINSSKGWLGITDKYWLTAIVPEKGKEFGTVTNRSRRCGWLDAVLVKQSCIISGINGIALTKLDVLDELDEIKMCIYYELDGKKIDYLPAASEDQFNVKPVYKIFPGWKSSTRGIRNIEELPDKAKAYINGVEDFVGAKISSISTSPKRKDTILIENPFS